jgi:polyisoprenoid-binding protein YceI
VVFDAKSINHENKDLKKHLKARDFFHVKKHPEITFEITSTNKDKVFGTLSIRGVSLEEVFTFEMIQKEGFVIFAGEAKIDRTKYGIKYNSSAYFQDLGNYAIKNEFDLNFRLVFQKPQDMMN